MGLDIVRHVIYASDIPTYVPASADEKYVRDAVAFLVIKSPFFAHLLYQECTIVYSHAIDLAATDGKQLLFNPINMRAQGWDIAEVAFVVAHEVSHCMFGDLYLRAKWRADGFVTARNGRQLKFFPEVMNYAEDYRINAMLVHAKIGKMPKIGLFDPTISAEGMESSVDIYEKLYDKLPPNYQGGGGSGTGKGFDLHLEPTKQAKREQDSGKMTQSIAAAVQAAEAAGQGTLPGAVKRLVGELLEPKVSWQDKLRSTTLRHVGDPAYNWRLMDRRLMVRPTPQYFAKTDTFGAGDIATIADNSGSITQKQFDLFFAEMAGIVADVNPMRLWAMWCDAKVRQVDELEEPEDLNDYYQKIKTEGVDGGGGTNFNPPFRWFDEHGIEPDLVVYFTDGHGTWPHKQPNYPVVWAILKGGNFRAPFGEMIEIEL